MENLSFVALLSTILIVGCREPDVAEPTPIDWGSRVTTDQIEEVLQIDTILPISPNGCFIANYDKTMMDGKMVYVLDKMQNAIFSIDTEECQVRKLIDKRGSAQNEYVGISDFSLGHDGTLWVFDSDSRKVNVYGDDGTYVKSMKVSCGSSLAVSRNGSVAISCNKNDDEAAIRVYDKDGNPTTSFQDDSGFPYTIEELGGVAATDDGFIYSIPFEYKIYCIEDGRKRTMAYFDCGERTFDTGSMVGQDYRHFLKSIMSSKDKVMRFDHLCQYDRYITFSTDMADQLLYDMKRDSVLVLSNAKMPYCLIFQTPLALGEQGDFCTILGSTDVDEALRPWLKSSQRSYGKLSPVLDGSNSGREYACWTVLGHIR